MLGITPFDRNRDLFDAFERDFFGAPAHRMQTFKTDITDEGDKFLLEAELPGFDKQDIKLDISGDCLTLSAEHSTENAEGDKEAKEKKYIRRERSYCSVSRSFDISGIDKDNIDAEYKNGILYMTLPKKQPEAPASRRLEIR